jgi:hypothetical protein
VRAGCINCRYDLAVLEIGVRQEEQIMNGPGSKGLVKPPWQVLKANIVVIQPEASRINHLKHDYRRSSGPHGSVSAMLTTKPFEGCFKPAQHREIVPSNAANAAKAGCFSTRTYP